MAKADKKTGLTRDQKREQRWLADKFGKLMECYHPDAMIGVIATLFGGTDPDDERVQHEFLPGSRKTARALIKELNERVAASAGPADRSPAENDEHAADQYEPQSITGGSHIDR